MAKTESGSISEMVITLESVRESLIRQEDTIVFSLIERAKYPRNSPLYDLSYASIPGFSGSLFQYIVSQSENLHAMVSCFLLGTCVAYNICLLSSFSLTNKLSNGSTFFFKVLSFSTDKHNPNPKLYCEQFFNQLN